MNFSLYFFLWTPIDKTIQKILYKIKFSFLCTPIDIVQFLGLRLFLLLWEITFLWNSIGRCVRGFWRHILFCTLLISDYHNKSIEINAVTPMYAAIYLHKKYSRLREQFQLTKRHQCISLSELGSKKTNENKNRATSMSIKISAFFSNNCNPRLPQKIDQHQCCHSNVCRLQLAQKVQVEATRTIPAD